MKSNYKLFICVVAGVLTELRAIVQFMGRR